MYHMVSQQNYFEKKKYLTTVLNYSILVNIPPLCIEQINVFKIYFLVGSVQVYVELARTF